MTIFVQPSGNAIAANIAIAIAGPNSGIISQIPAIKPNKIG